VSKLITGLSYEIKLHPAVDVINNCQPIMQKTKYAYWNNGKAFTIDSIRPFSTVADVARHRQVSPRFDMFVYII